MTIDASFVRRKCKLRGVLVTRVQSDVRDGMNRPIDTERRVGVRFWKHPEETAEITAGRLVETRRETAYFPLGTRIESTSQLIFRGETFEFDGPAREWVHPITTKTVGYVATVVRTS